MIHELIITVAKFIQELPQTESFRATGLSEENLSCLGQFQGSMVPQGVSGYHREEIQAHIFLQGHFWYKGNYFSG